LTVLEDKLFIASGAGLGWMFLNDNSIYLPKDKTLNTRTIHQITVLDSTLLVATDYGLYEYDPETERFAFFKISAALPEYGTTAINTNADSLWIAGPSGVILFNQKSKEWFSFTQLRNQLNAQYFDIAFSGKFVWFATSKGLLRYNTEQNSWYLYTRKDGLASNHVYHIDVDGDFLWLSTEGGLTSFYWNREDRIE
jgi:ligand-binding sensor domain-containing protein